MIILLALILIANSQTPPVWPDQFEIDFNETTKVITSFSTKGRIYFDWTNKRELVSREDGKGDRYCNTVEKFTSTPCNHYIVDGKRYLDFPNKKYCCYCCNSTNGCGILLPNWLSTATYMGQEKLYDGVSYEKWDMKGLQDNYYYNQIGGKRIMRRLDQHPNDLMDFQPSTYYEGIRDNKVFNLPSYCTSTCGATTICAELR